MYSIALVGATSYLGKALFKLLAKSSIFANWNIFLISSPELASKKPLLFKDEIHVLNINNFLFRRIDIVFFTTTYRVAKFYIPKILKHCGLIIDLSSYFNFYTRIALIAPEVNANILFEKQRLIAISSITSTALVMVLINLYKYSNIRKITVSTYQACSELGKKGIAILYKQTKNRIFTPFGLQNRKSFFAFNIAPIIRNTVNNNYSSQELSILLEIQKILKRSVNLNILFIRVPTFVGYGFSICIELKNSTIDSFYLKLLLLSKGLVITQDNNYYSLTDCLNNNNALISGIRVKDRNTLILWLVLDNLCKNPALSAVQTAEYFFKKYF